MTRTASDPYHSPWVYQVGVRMWLPRCTCGWQARRWRYSKPWALRVADRHVRKADA